MVIDKLGGRKNVLGYLFLSCTTFLVYVMLTQQAAPDYLGMATVIGAIATGIGALVWGNVKEHQTKGNGHAPTS